MENCYCEHCGTFRASILLYGTHHCLVCENVIYPEQESAQDFFDDDILANEHLTYVTFHTQGQHKQMHF